MKIFKIQLGGFVQRFFSRWVRESGELQYLVVTEINRSNRTQQLDFFGMPYFGP